MPKMFQHHALHDVKQFERFQLIYKSAAHPRDISVYYYTDNRCNRSDVPLFGLNHTVLFDAEIDSKLIEGAEKFAGSKITPITLHAFQDNISAVKLLLLWGANIQNAIQGYAAAGKFETEETTRKFLESIKDLTLRARFAEAADEASVTKFKVEEELPKFRLAK